MIQELLKKDRGDLAARIAVSAVLQGIGFIGSFRQIIRCNTHWYRAGPHMIAIIFMTGTKYACNLNF